MIGPYIASHRACKTQKIFKLSQFFHDKMQEHNAEEYKDRIWVYPCIATSINVKAMQRNASPYILLWTGLNKAL